MVVSVSQDEKQKLVEYKNYLEWEKTLYYNIENFASL